MVEGFLAVIGLVTVIVLGSSFTTGLVFGTHKRFKQRVRDFQFKIERSISTAFHVGRILVSGKQRKHHSWRQQPRREPQ